MGLFDKIGTKIKQELIDIIEWLDSTSDTMIYRYERHGNEIKYGAKLVVRESQEAIFINEGKLADVFQPGTYTLETKNLPVLSTLQGWKYGFESPFKAEVYFVSKKQFTNLKWGLKNPVMLRDPEFGPVRLRAFGAYSIRIVDGILFLREIVGTDGLFSKHEITNQLRDMTVSRFTDVLGESKIPVLDLAANYDELGSFMRERISEDFKAYGLELTNMLIENISLPPAVEEALDKRTSMGVIGNLNAYTQFQTAEAIRDAAKNPAGGGMADGMGMGMGFAMAQQMAQAMQPGAQSQPTASPSPAPPPLPPTIAYHVADQGKSIGPLDLGALKQMAVEGRFTRDTLVWKEGMAQWAPAGQVAELSSVFGAAPPPIPPAPPPA